MGPGTRLSHQLKPWVRVEGARLTYPPEQPTLPGLEKE